MNDLALSAPVALPILERYAIPAAAVQDATGELTRQLRAGDEAAWRHFHEIYAPRLFRYLLVVSGGREEAAREALQHTFLRAVKHVREFETEPALWSWLTVLARTAFVDELRRDSRRASLLGRWLALGSPRPEMPAPNGEADAHLRGLMEAGLAQLAPEDRALLEQKYFDGESVRQIAVAQALTEKAVEARLGRARQKLRALVMARLRNEDPH